MYLSTRGMLQVALVLDKSSSDVYIDVIVLGNG